MQILRSVFGFGGNHDTDTINSNPGSNSDTAPPSNTPTPSRSRVGTLRGKSISARALSRLSIYSPKSESDVNPSNDRYDVCVHTLIKVKTSESEIEEKLSGRVYFASFHEENKSNDILNIEGYIFFPIELVGRELEDNEIKVDHQPQTLVIKAKKIDVNIGCCLSEIVSKQTGHGGHKYGTRPLSIELGKPSARLKRLSGFKRDRVMLEDLYLPEVEADQSN
ncbi:MAG: hypothetical protein CK425_03940 [Parachlamydia sp.]|nr:MAG: hypothetical protein CK425_03940 [Parachlamydia sp.]